MTPTEERAWISMAKDGTLKRFLAGGDYYTCVEYYQQELRKRARILVNVE